MTNLFKLREKINAGITDPTKKISIFAFIVKAYSLAIKDYPKMNSLYNPGEDATSCKIMANHNISIAIDTPNGLMAPNIKSVNKLSIREVQEEIFRLRDLATEGKLGTNELFGGTIALSNIGTIGGTYAGPVNLPEQSCIVALGKVKDVPRFVTPQIVDGKTLYDVDMGKTVIFSNFLFIC